MEVFRNTCVIHGMYLITHQTLVSHHLRPMYQSFRVVFRLFVCACIDVYIVCCRVPCHHSDRGVVFHVTHIR